jgi:hypothetical protein
MTTTIKDIRKKADLLIRTAYYTGKADGMTSARKIVSKYFTMKGGDTDGKKSSDKASD